MLFPQVFYVSIEYTTKNTVSAPRLPGYSKMSSIPYNFPGPVSSFIMKSHWLLLSLPFGAVKLERIITVIFLHI